MKQERLLLTLLGVLFFCHSFDSGLDWNKTTKKFGEGWGQ